MPASKKSTARNLKSHNDDIPDLSTPEWQARFAKGVRSDGDMIVSGSSSRIIAGLRGRPPLAEKKISTTLRLDSVIVKHFKAGGVGWQTRINETLLKSIGVQAGFDKFNEKAGKRRAAASKSREKS